MPEHQTAIAIRGTLEPDCLSIPPETHTDAPPLLRCHPDAIVYSGAGTGTGT